MSWRITAEGFSLCQYEPWIQAGIRHGMFGAPLDFRAPKRAASIVEVEQFLGLEFPIPVRWLRQTHSAILLGVGLPAEVPLAAYTPDAEGDGFVFSRSGSKGTYALTTADCLAITMISGDWGALVHAGWRGLAAQIVPTAAQILHNLSDAPIDVVISPHASVAKYEVGKEVIDAFSLDDGIVSRRENGRFYLDLSGTARAQVEVAGVPIAGWHDPDICTIQHSTWHSHRRDGERSGRNVTVIAQTAITQKVIAQ